MENALLNLSTTNEKLVLSNQIIELKDFTSVKFNTNKLASFASYIGDYNALCFMTEDSVIAYEHDKIEGTNFLEPDYNKPKLAICSISVTDQIKVLCGLNGQKLSVQAMDKQLRKLKKLLTAKSRDAHKAITNLSIKKVISVDRSADTQGNFNYKVTAGNSKGESAGKEDAEFPESIIFEVPLLKRAIGSIKLEFELIFEWEASSEGFVNLFFTLNNFELDDQISEAKFAAIEKHMAMAKNAELYEGSIELHRSTDEWKYKQMPLIVSNR